jgi:hypothetical protein
MRTDWKRRSTKAWLVCVIYELLLLHAARFITTSPVFYSHVYFYAMYFCITEQCILHEISKKKTLDTNLLVTRKTVFMRQETGRTRYCNS